MPFGTGAALLEWADALYRTADDSSIRRARELYKAVGYLHGWGPDLAPNWPGAGSLILLVPYFRAETMNPAILSQLGRANRMLFQIDRGMNYYGYTDETVPSLRYRPLKDAADRFAAAAKAAESEYLDSFSKAEEAIKEGFVTANLLKKAQLQSSMADEQKGIADYGVQVAQNQLDQVNAAIKKKQDEINDHDGLGQQFVDWFGGFVHTLTSIPSELTGGLGEGVKAGVGLSEAAGSGGLFGGGGWLGLGAGASVAGAYGIFMYAAISSELSVYDADKQRTADLNTLQTQSLPLAEAQLVAKQNEVHIATLQGQIAQADADLALDLFHFQATRNLTTEFWASIAAVLKRVLRRYLELAAKFAWLAERALAYEQDRNIDIIRFDYFPSKLYNVTGADLLQLDLAEVEASRLEGVRQTVPIKQTYSLAFDFPLAFVELKKTGKTSFRVDEATLYVSYPGIYGYRVRAITVSIQTVSPASAFRGILTNNGVSLISRKDGSKHFSARMAEGFPLSEFRIAEDFAVYSLPDESLMNFEGSGLESFWTLELPPGANPFGLEPIADILITFDVIGNYSPELHQKHLAASPSNVQKFVLASAAAQNKKTLDDFKGVSPSVTIVFDMKKARLSNSESNRKVKNVVLCAAGVSSNFTAAFKGTTPTQAADVSFAKGVAMSNIPPLGDTRPAPPPPAPLNVFANAVVDQSFELTIAKAPNPGVDFSKITDVILGLEYSAHLG